MEKTKQFLWGIFFCVLAVRLILAFTLPTFTYESYFHLRQTEHITATGLPLYHDPLSYGGRELIFLPLFHYLAAFFDLFLPLEFVAKVLPNLLLAGLVLLTYFIARELGYSTHGSLFTAGIAGFLPAIFSTNAFTPYSLFLPLIFFAIYAFLKLQQKGIDEEKSEEQKQKQINIKKNSRMQKKYVYLYLIAFLLATLTSPATILLLLGFGIYFLISLAENKKLPRDEWEIFIASTFFYLWIQLVFFNEVINYWDIEKQNLKRKDKILNSYDLDKLNSKIGKSVGIQFLYLLCPELDKKTINSIAYSYGFAIKLADNVSDLNEDLNNGFINISKENIKKYNLDLKNLTEEKLNPYIQDELNRIKDYYKKGDEELNLVLVKYPSSRTGVLLFKEIAYSWFKQVLEVYKKIKRLERDSNPRPHG